jgi:hypothetical protein
LVPALLRKPKRGGHMKKVNSKKKHGKKAGHSKIQDQYKLLRKDVLKLRHDLEHGYEMLRNLFESSMKSKATKPN